MKLSFTAKVIIRSISILLAALLLMPLWNYVAVPAGVALPIGYGAALCITLFTSALNEVGKALFSAVVGQTPR